MRRPAARRAVLQATSLHPGGALGYLYVLFDSSTMQARATLQVTGT